MPFGYGNGDDYAAPSFDFGMFRDMWDWATGPAQGFGQPSPQPVPPPIPPQPAYPPSPRLAGPGPMQVPEYPWSTPPEPPMRAAPIGPGGTTNEMFQQPPPLQPGGDATFGQFFDQEPTYPPRSMVEDMQPPPQLNVPPTPPDPYDVWSRGYESSTEAQWHAQRKAAKNRMFIEMGQALMANSHDPSMALAGAGEAVKNWGSAKVGLDQFRESRDDRKMDILYRLRQMQELGKDRGMSRPQVLADGTVIQYGPNGEIYKVEEGGTLVPIRPDEFGDMKEGAEDSERQEREREKTEGKEAQKRNEFWDAYREVEKSGPNSLKQFITSRRADFEKYGKPGNEASGTPDRAYIDGVDIKGAREWIKTNPDMPPAERIKAERMTDQELANFINAKRKEAGV